MTNIFATFVPMNIFIKFFRFVILTLIILPIWLTNCLAGFSASILLHYLFSHKENNDKKYRNNMREIFRVFIFNFTSIFYYY